MFVNHRTRFALAVAAACGIAGVNNRRANAQTYLYTGVGSSSWNTTASNKNFFNTSSGLASQFVAGANAQFDDSATGSTTIAVPFPSISVGSMTFNSSSLNYNFSSAIGAISAGSTANLTLNGSGTVTFSASYVNSATNGVNGLASINSGILKINGSNGGLSIPMINIAPGALLTVNSGASATTTGSSIVNGAFSLVSNSTSSIFFLSGSGTTNVDSTSSLSITNSNYSGNLKVSPGGTFTKLSVSTIAVLAGTNSLSGSTNISAGTLQLGAVDLYGVSSQSQTANLSNQPGSLLFGPSSNGYSQLDLAGTFFNVSSLNGTNPLSVITSKPQATAANPGATLYVTQSTGNSTYAGRITQYIPRGSSYTTAGPVSLVFNGTGNQILSGDNSYSGGTMISGGTVTAASATALGTGPVTLAGGTLSLTASTTEIFGGLVAGSGATQFEINHENNPGVANTISNGVLTLTDNSTTGEDTSAFTNQKVALPSSGFTVSFTYSAQPPSGMPGSGANGATFTLENDPAGASAIGLGADGLGYKGLQNSFALCLNEYPNSGIAVAGSGVVPTSFSGLGGNNFSSVLVTVIYNPTAHTVTATLANGVGVFVSYTYTNENLNTLLGGNSAYLGFTGSTGGITSSQTISNFSFSSNSTGPTNIANPIIALPDTSSQVTITTSNGSTGYTSGAVGEMSIGDQAILRVVSTSTPGGVNRGTLTVPSLSLSGTTDSWSGQLDLGNNALDIQAGDLATVTNQLKQGYAAGTWQGSGGITSSAAAAASSRLTALGVIVNDNGSGNPLYGSGGTIAATFNGANPLHLDVLVKYTYYGDSNLDGKVDGSDYALVDNGYLQHLTGWYNGDFNYDGAVDGSDYTLIDNAFNTQGSSLATEIASPSALATSQIAGATGTSAVPEPTILGLIGIAASGLLGRRGRK